MARILRLHQHPDHEGEKHDEQRRTRQPHALVDYIAIVDHQQSARDRRCCGGISHVQGFEDLGRLGSWRGAHVMALVMWLDGEE